MNEAVREKKPELRVVRRDPEIYRVDTFVMVVNQAKREKEFDNLFGGTIRKMKQAVNMVVDALTTLLSLIGLGTAIWFIATVLV